MDHTEVTFFDKINFPEDLRKVDVKDLRAVCTEVRDFLVDAVSKTGGHLGAGLGTVELAVALHYAFNTPIDKIIWDVGHQAYPHKLLTGRKDRFHGLRQLNGISGFLRRDESEYDVFGAGHASTAVSAALGVAAARDFKGENFKVVAVVGDGSLTGGMAYEGMNNAGLLKKDMIVVLNDNQMVSLSSYSPQTWSLQNYFNEVLTHPAYNTLKANVWDLTGKLDTFGDRLRVAVQKVEKGVKAVVTPGMLFEALGFRYLGPFNGHNVVKLVEVFRHVKDLHGPILIHTVTKKGKGYPPAEKEITRLHGVTPFDKVTGTMPKSSAPPAYTALFGKALVEICKMNPKVVGITAAMADGTGLTILQKEMPERYFDVGIAEQHAVTFAAGMATEGYIPVTAIYSTFLQRAYDQVIHDVALQHLPIVLVLDRGGLVGVASARNGALGEVAAHVLHRLHRRARRARLQQRREVPRRAQRDADAESGSGDRVRDRGVAGKELRGGGADGGGGGDRGAGGEQSVPAPAVRAPGSIPITRLPLVADSQDQNGIRHGVVPVESYVPGRTV